MILETDRLLLRPWKESDAEECYRYARDPAVGPVTGWPAHQSLEESRRIIRNVLSVPENYALVWKETGLPVGSIGLRFAPATDLTDRADECELGFWLGVPYWGRGIMTEAAREILRHAFMDLGAGTVWCGYYEGNERSRRVQEKCGFRYQYTITGKDVPLLGERRTEQVSCLTREEWQAGQDRENLVERLLEMPYWIVDILPAQVPAGAGGQYFSVEQYFLKPPRITAIRRKHAEILMRLGYDMAVSFDGGESWEQNPDSERLARKAEELTGSGFLRALFEPVEMMADLEPEETWMTVYNPCPVMLERLRKLAAEKGLFVWQPQP